MHGVNTCIYTHTSTQTWPIVPVLTCTLGVSGLELLAVEEGGALVGVPGGCGPAGGCPVPLMDPPAGSRLPLADAVGSSAAAAAVAAAATAVSLPCPDDDPCCCCCCSRSRAAAPPPLPECGPAPEEEDAAAAAAAVVPAAADAAGGISALVEPRLLVLAVRPNGALATTPAAAAFAASRAEAGTKRSTLAELFWRCTSVRMAWTCVGGAAPRRTDDEGGWRGGREPRGPEGAGAGVACQALHNPQCSPPIRAAQ